MRGYGMLCSLQVESYVKQVERFGMCTHGPTVAAAASTEGTRWIGAGRRSCRQSLVRNSKSVNTSSGTLWL